MRNLLKRSLWVMSLIMVFNAQSADLTVFNDVLKKYRFAVAKDSSREQLMSSALSLVAYHNVEHVALLETLLKELSKELSKKLSKERIQARKAILNSLSFDGCTLLVAAVVSKNVKKVDLLLNYGADSNVKDSKYQRTPLVHALKNGSFDIALLLCSRGADQTLDDCCRGSIAFLRRQIALKNEKKSKDKGAAAQVEKKKKQPAIDPDSVHGMLVACSGPAHFTFDQAAINNNASLVTEDDVSIGSLQSDCELEKYDEVKDVITRVIALAIAERNEQWGQLCLADLIQNEPDALLSLQQLRTFKTIELPVGSLLLRRTLKRFDKKVNAFSDQELALDDAGLHKRKSEGDCA